MKGFAPLLLVVIVFLTACSSPSEPKGTGLKGYWITDLDGKVMLDPQTSGLAIWRGKLLTIADGSADVSQRLRLHTLDGPSATLFPSSQKFTFSERVQQSCFLEYLSVEPDFEALVVDPKDDNVVILVTEDATRTGELSPDCARRYANTGSTEYPTLLVRLELQENGSVVVSHVRPIRYQEAHNVGDSPNDGIEGMAMSPTGTLYLGLEKDDDNQPRIFAVNVDEYFWDTEDFALVRDPMLKVPRFDSGNHPINGMDYIQRQDGGEFIIAAARNDEEIWIIDVAAKQETKVIPVHFYAELYPPADHCESWELMHNASLEGVAVDGDVLWLINDPWKRNYMKNVKCESNRANYEKMAPLLFNMPIEADWFAPAQ